MDTKHITTIELGTASLVTSGAMMGFADSEGGLTWQPGLQAD
ncbi:hypothetical protein SAMN03159338_2781 [Sphingomonas sp. NFR04]|nr:hypothetical protein [Sphingomonas sp. NFR04]SFJ96845.1 hypothetical protein SAMN03159338_2781 [Sphingomonas sp. NFR04]